MAKKNKLEHLRDHLFETLEMLKDEEKPFDIARAHAICAVSQSIIQTAKVELEALRLNNTNGSGSQFFNVPEESRELPAPRQISRGAA